MFYKYSIINPRSLQAPARFKAFSILAIMILTKDHFPIKIIHSMVNKFHNAFRFYPNVIKAIKFTIFALELIIITITCQKSLAQIFIFQNDYTVFYLELQILHRINSPDYIFTASR